jgi:hypothetical protein
VERTMVRQSRVRYMVGSEGGGVSYEEWKASGGVEAVAAASESEVATEKSSQQQQSA